ncbi:MAG: DUF92 domain-containing protein [Acidobacteriota bacterium]
MANAPQIFRKVVHMAFGTCAILLKWMSPVQAIALAVAAFLFNLFLLPYVGGKYIARGERGFDRGILLYPLAVLVLILVFPYRPEISAAVWMILAFGDGSAALFGTVLRSPSLPWNETKSVAGTVAFVVVSLVPVWWIATFMHPGSDRRWMFLVVALTVTGCAAVESLKTSIDDNITVPLTGALFMVALLSCVARDQPVPGTSAWIWIGINAALAVAGYAARSVSISGLIGGLVLGAIIILGGGWQLYLVLLAFFIIGSAGTRLGFDSKSSLGVAQEGEGRRGFSHAFANAGLAAMIAALIPFSQYPTEMLFLAAAAALVTATADTTASEIGQLLGRRAFLPLTFRRVERGTEGAISVEGTLAGAAAAFIVALVGVLGLRSRIGGFMQASGSPKFWDLVLILTVAGIVGSYLESVIGSWNRRQREPIPNGVMNFMNTLFGSAVAVILWMAVVR